MLQGLFDGAGEFNAARWVLLSQWSTAVLVLVLLAVLAIVGLAWHNVRRQPRRQRWTLVSLRVVAVLVLGTVFLQPGVRLENVTRVRNHVVMLVDGSRSMDLPGEDATRLAEAQAALAAEASVVEAWRADHQVDWFSFSDHARPVADAAAIKATGDASRVVAALEDVAARFRPEELAAVVVVSDGADNGVLGESVPGGEIPAGAQAVASRLGAPIHTVFTGPNDPPRDVAITEVAYDDFAFVRNAVSIEATVTVHGYDNLALPVTLKRGTHILGSKSLQLRDGKKRYDFEFEFVPDKTGKAVFTLEVGAAPNEQIRVNNRRQFVIRIIRDKIRVLQVVGRPSWDERFMRKLLKKNPNVDLISFFILRTSASIDVARRDELSLIPFPTQELFEDQLGSFDLIIFQNFTYRGYRMRQYLPFIRDYVHNGGGFVMIGGDQSFTPGGYAGTPIAEFLPVTLPQGPTDLVAKGAFQGQLTEAGLNHPITALSLVPEENRAIWKGLPKLEGINRVVGLARDSTALVVHPSERAGGALAPVVATRTFGEGRVLSVGTDTTWSWAFKPADEGGDARHYYKFWNNAIRWLIKDPELNPVRVEADRDRYPLGAEVTLISRVVGSDYAAAAGVPVKLRIERRWTDTGGEARRAVVAEPEGETTETGEWLTRLVPEGDGAYVVVASAEIDGRVVDDREVFVVAPDPIELRRTAARASTLAMLAKAGGGEARTLADGLDGLSRTEPKVVKVNRRRDVPLWASGWLLLIAILLPSTEWYLRRRWGLL
jgi:uncharacterized membrane protein